MTVSSLQGVVFDWKRGVVFTENEGEMAMHTPHAMLNVRNVIMDTAGTAGAPRFRSTVHTTTELWRRMNKRKFKF